MAHAYLQTKEDELLVDLSDALEKYNRYANQRGEQLHWEHILKRRILEAIDRKMYPVSTPAMDEHGFDHFQMVVALGHAWHMYPVPHKCQACKKDLRNKRLGPPFKLEIVHRSVDKDCVIALECPRCGTELSRNGRPNEQG